MASRDLADGRHGIDEATGRFVVSHGHEYGPAAAVGCKGCLDQRKVERLAKPKIDGRARDAVDLEDLDDAGAERTVHGHDDRPARREQRRASRLDTGGGRTSDEKDTVLAACPEQRAAVAAQARYQVRETPVAVTDLGL